MSAAEEETPPQQIEQNTVIAACIATGVGVVVLYAVLIGLGSMQNDAGETVRLWFSCLPWIPKALKEEDGEEDQVSGEDLKHASIRRAARRLPGRDKDAKSADEEPWPAGSDRMKEESQQQMLSDRQRKAISCAREGLAELSKSRQRYAGVLAKYNKPVSNEEGAETTLSREAAQP